MKFVQVLKSVAAATAFVAAGSAVAAIATVDTTNDGVHTYISSSVSTLNFSAGDDLAGIPGALQALNAGATEITAIAPATANVLYDVDGLITSAVINTTNSALTYDDTTGAVQTLSTVGGAKQKVTSTAVVVSPTASNVNYSVTVTNLKFDLTSNTIFADVAFFNPAGTQVGSTLAGLDFFKFNAADLTGTTTFTGAPAPGQSMTFSSGVSKVYLSKNGYTNLGTGLHLNTTGKNALKGMVLDATINPSGPAGWFASVDTTITVTTPVFESSTYVLMGLGLAVCGFVARRRSLSA